MDPLNGQKNVVIFGDIWYVVPWFCVGAWISKGGGWLSQLCTDHVVTCVQVTGDFGKEWPLGCARDFQREGTILLPVAPMESSWCRFFVCREGWEAFEMKINGKGIGPSPVYLTGAFFPMSPLRFEQINLERWIHDGYFGMEALTSIQLFFFSSWAHMCLIF